MLSISFKKAARKGDIRTKVFKNSISVYLSELTLLFNNCLKKGVFLDDLKVADKTPEITACRPVSKMSQLSKVFESNIY